MPGSIHSLNLRGDPSFAPFPVLFFRFFRSFLLFISALGDQFRPTPLHVSHTRA